MDKRDIERYLLQVEKECLSIGIPISTSIAREVKINKRIRSRFASCRKETVQLKQCFSIEIGQRLLQGEEHVVKGILAHEVLHTCEGCQNHGPLWKEYAVQMNQVYGYSIKARCSYEELGLEKPEVQRQIKYVIICKKCGNTFYRERKSKLTIHTSQYRCKCGGKLTCQKAEY